MATSKSKYSFPHISSMKYVMLIVLAIMFANIVVAEESGGILIGKQNDCIILPQECASCSYVKLTTVTFPNMSQVSIQLNMVQDGTSYNYNFCNTVQFGSYTYCMIGDVDGTNTVACKDFQITSTGDDRGISWILVLFLGSIILLVIALATKNAYLGVISGLSLGVSGVYMMIFGFNNIADLYTQMIALVIIGVGFYIIFAFVGELLSSYDEGGEILDD